MNTITVKVTGQDIHVYEPEEIYQCHNCSAQDTCIHSGAFRRHPVSEKGLGLCPNLKDGCLFNKQWFFKPKEAK
jgi:hypothetical protein